MHPNPRSFADALAPHFADVVRYCRALAARRSELDPDDLLQEGLLRAASRFHDLQDAERFRPWLFRIITRTYLSERRRAWWRRWTGSEPLPHMPAVLSDAPDGAAADLLAALATLKPRERTAVVLADLCGFTLDEIRFVQGDRSLSAVKSRVVRARMRLREAITSPVTSSLAAEGTLQSLMSHESERARAALDARS